MKKLFFLILTLTTLAAAGQETIGKLGGIVEARGNLRVRYDLILALKDTTTAPYSLGAMRRRPQDGYVYICSSLTGRKWYPLVPITGADVIYLGRGLVFENGTINARLASTSDSGIITKEFYTALQTTIAKRVTDVQFSNTNPVNFTLSYNDGTQIVRPIPGGNGSGGVSSVTATPLTGLFNINVANQNTTPAISYTFEQQSPYTVFGRAGGTGIPSFQKIGAEWVETGIFNPARLPVATATAAGALSAADYSRLFVRQTLTNPTTTISLNISNGGQAGIAITSTGNRSLSFSNLRAGDVFNIAFTNTSGAAMLLSLPTTSYLSGVGTAASVSIPVGRSALELVDFDGSNYWFRLLTF